MTHPNSRLSRIVFLLTTLCASSVALAADNPSTELTTNSQPDNWSFNIVPYLWLATYDGTFGFPNIPAGAVATTHTETSSPFSTRISAAAMLTAQIQYRSFGLLLDGAWLQLKTEGDFPSPLYSGTEIKSDIAYGSPALTWRVPGTGKLDLDILAGARIWYVGNTIDFHTGTAPGFSADASRVWTDPIIGAKLHYPFTKNLFGVVLGDAGGFGVGSDLSWNVFGGFGWSFSKTFSMTLGYRYLHVDYQKGGFVMDANVQGFLLGFGFRF
jgi:hypothetical protein